MTRVGSTAVSAHQVSGRTRHKSAMVAVGRVSPETTRRTRSATVPIRPTPCTTLVNAWEKLMNHISVFVASTNDLAEHRQCVSEATDQVEKLLRRTQDAEDLVLDTYRWEVDAVPTPGHPQDVINPGLDEADIVVLLAWKRIGEGTMEEYDRALERWAATDRPHIMVYFCQTPFFPKLEAEQEAFQNLWSFQRRVEKEVLAARYDGPSDLRQKLLNHLQKVILEILKGKTRTNEERLFRVLAHNIKTPLYHLRSDLDVLTAGFLESDTNRRKEKYFDMRNAVLQIDSLVEGVLSAGDRHVEPNASKTDVLMIVRDAVRAARKRARARDVTIELEMPPDEQIAINTDPDMLHSIALNLLDNAVNYGPAQGVVRVSVTVDRHGIQLRVADQGEGVPAKERKRIFQAFIRGSKASKLGIPGVGLGLYVAQRFAEALGGRLQLASNGPTTFSLWLPSMPVRER